MFLARTGCLDVVLEILDKQHNSLCQMKAKHQDDVLDERPRPREKREKDEDENPTLKPLEPLGSIPKERA